MSSSGSTTWTKRIRREGIRRTGIGIRSEEIRRTGIAIRRNLLPFGFALMSLLLYALPSSAKLLQGNVSETGTARLQRPVDSQPGNQPDGPPVAPSRLSRAPASTSAPLQGLVDTASFGTPLQGQAHANDMRMGIVKPDEFKLPKGFDLGTESNNREMVLAWEQWHKQFSRAIYERWSEVADEPGRATVKVTVTKDRQITVSVLDSTGSRRFTGQLRSVIESLNGNPGLTFPSKSQRQVVSFEADYIAAHDITPGYSWVKNDYEKVRESY